MSDFETGGTGEKGGFDQMTKGLRKMTGNPFFGFSKPYLDFIGKGKLFGIIYIVMAILSLCIPFAVIFKVVDSGDIDYSCLEAHMVPGTTFNR